MTFNIPNTALFKQQALQWAATFDVCCCLDSNHYHDSYSKFDCLIAAGVRYEVTAQAGDAFNTLQKFRKKHTGWMTGFLGYDLKNETEQLSSANPDLLNFPDLYFFVPQSVITIKANQAEITAADPQQIWDSILKFPVSVMASSPRLTLRSKFTEQQYVDTFDQIRQHIIRGDIYVTNFCQEFFADDAVIDPLQVFQELNRLSPTPFASFFKYRKQFIICASPERFLAKRSHKIISQPIKGTAKRGKTTAQDEMIKQSLRNNLKEQQENVMVVDLVRNDLTKSAEPGTVKTEELFGIYSFEQVHQMISTVTCQFKKEGTVIEAIRNTFPMGSMTGAPKLSAMQLMEYYERSRRGIYSGAIGYLSPDNDFDFNVVIRTIIYNAANRYLSFQVGSAITFDAVARQEYAECLLKAQAIMQVLRIESEN